MSRDGATARLEDSKTGPCTLWFGPEAVEILVALPRRDGQARVFPEDLTSARLDEFWVGVREEAGLRGVRIHDARHTHTSQGVMNCVGLTVVGKMLATASAPRPPRRQPSLPALWVTGPRRRPSRARRTGGMGPKLARSSLAQANSPRSAAGDRPCCSEAESGRDQAAPHKDTIKPSHVEWRLNPHRLSFTLICATRNWTSPVTGCAVPLGMRGDGRKVRASMGGSSSGSNSSSFACFERGM